MNGDRELEILYVEDSAEDAELAIAELKRHNLANRLRHVTDGQAALDAVFGNGAAAPALPRMILLDLKLPKVDGIEVLRRLRADERTRQVPVVVMTSSREEQDIVETYALGINSYVVKPVSFEEFAAAVAKIGLYWVLLNQPPVSRTRGKGDGAA